MSEIPSSGHSELLLSGARVLTLDPEARVFEGGGVLISEGKIAAVGGGLEAPEGCLEIDLGGHILLPGLVQAHIHLGQTMFRGLAEGRTLLPWLKERIWPLEAAHDDESAYWCSLLGAAECLLGGTTSIQEIGLGPGIRGLLDAVVESGLRASAGMCLMDEGEALPPGLAARTDDVLRQTIDLGEAYDGIEEGRISYSLNPRFLLSASDQLWKEVRAISLDRGWPIHTHALEQAEETEAVRALKGGLDEIGYFEAEGVLDGDLRIAHGVGLTDEHLSRVDRDRFSVAHCPSANLKLGSGIADVVRIREARVPVGVGADGAGCNNDLDCLEEIRLAALLQQGTRGPGAFSGLDALRLATSEGARAIGLGDSVGSIEEGKLADLLVLDVSGPEWSADPSCDPHDLVVYSGTRSAVRHVMVGGRWLVWDGALRGLDLSRIRDRVGRHRSLLVARAALVD